MKNGKNEDSNFEDAVNPCPPEGLDQEDNALLRGDAIGDTAYTHRWVLKCLMIIMKSLPKYLTKLNQQFNSDIAVNDDNESNNDYDNPLTNLINESSNSECGSPKIQELSSDVEDAACQLWDMTVERDVTLHLLDMDQVNVIQITALICDQSTAPRLTEVMVGVIANMCCQEEGCRKVLDESMELLDSISYLLGSCQDAPTLCEVLRLLRLLVWHRVNRSDSSLLALCPLIKILSTEYTRGALSFLLNNSLSDSLLCGLVELLSSVLFICLPAIGLNLASLYSQPEMISGLIQVCKQNSSLIDDVSEESNTMHDVILCLYAFIDTPGEKLLQCDESVSILEKTLPKYIEQEASVDSPEKLIGPIAAHLIHALGLCQLLVPYTGPTVTIQYVGRLLSLIQGETHHYTVSRENPYEDEASSRDSFVGSGMKPSFERQISSNRKGKRASIEGVSMMKIEKTKDIPKSETHSSMSIDISLGWMSPPSLGPSELPHKSVTTTINTSRMSPVAENESDKETSLEVLPEDLKENLCSLEESLEEFCTQMVCWWWTARQKKSKNQLLKSDNNDKRRRSKVAFKGKNEKTFQPRETLLCLLDQCHAHEVFYILDAVRRADPQLVPSIQEYVLDSGKHHRLVALLAHMYQ